MFTCPDCGATSNHPDDAEHSYCNRCHQYKVCALCLALNVSVSVRNGLCTRCKWPEAERATPA